MRKVILSTNMTLDGFFAGPNNELDWTVADEELHDFYSDLLQNADLLIFGRVTYLMMREYWPTAASDPSLPAGMLRFANTINSNRKLVFSKTLKEVDWNTELQHEIDAEEIRSLKAQPGKYILVSGSNVGNQFLSNGWVDEIRLVIMPVAIGQGKPFFGALRQGIELELNWTKTMNSGAVALCYRVKGQSQK